MCLIVVKPKNTALVNKEYLKNGAENNSDGLGIAYVKDNSNQVNIKKDFKNVEELIKFVEENIKIEDALMVHFRMATHGLKDEGNRHPFPITKNINSLRELNVICNLAVAHNGVISEYNKDKKLSDTQKFTLDILAEEPIKNNLHNPAIIKLIQEFIGLDRLAILNQKGHFTIIGNWEKEEEHLFSNTGYKKYRTNFYNANFFHGSHYNTSHYNTSKYDTKNTTNFSDENKNLITIIGNCEFCNKRKSIKEAIINDIDFMLCRNCRKKAKKNQFKVLGLSNTLVLKTKEDYIEENNKEKKPPILLEDTLGANNTPKIYENQFKCDSCLEIKDKSELESSYEYLNFGWKICKTCAEKKSPEDKK